ncbi:MAG: putative outer membrane protein [Spartobacteria bacterium]|nr:putative outer membrane protein [Spartobacteria bacterium]
MSPAADRKDWSRPKEPNDANLRCRMFRRVNIEKFMKNKLTITSCPLTALLGLALFCLITPAKAAHEHSASSKAKGADKNLSSADKSFINNAAKGGMMEVDGGKVAAEKSQNADVKKFGNRMVVDHSKANNELKAIAAKKGVTVPNDKSSVKWKSDKSYMSMMVKDHEKDLAEFQGEAKNGSDPDLKKFADKTSKIIQKHLDMAKEIDGKLK